VKAVDQNSAGFVCLKRKIPRISDAKIKEGVFFNTGSEVEKEAWKSLKNVTTNFLWEIIRQKSIVKWWLILCCHAMLGVKYVFKGALLRLTLRLLLRKSLGSERCAQRVISPRHFQRGNAVPRQVESQSAG
jgi:hypothetical protein